MWRRNEQGVSLEKRYALFSFAPYLSAVSNLTFHTSLSLSAYIRLQKRPTSAQCNRPVCYKCISALNREKLTYNKNDVDFIFWISIETENFAIIPIEEVPSSGIIEMSEQYGRKKYFNTSTALEEYTAGDFNL